MDLQKLLEIIGIESKEVVSCYLIGSKAYNNEKPTSDYDIILVVEESCPRKWRGMNWLHDHGWVAKSDRGVYSKCKRDFYGCKEFQVWIYSAQTFQKMLNQYVPFAVECLFVPEKNIWKANLKFKLPNPMNSNLLYSSYSTVSEMHYERAKIEFGTHSATLEGKKYIPE